MFAHTPAASVAMLVAAATLGLHPVLATAQETQTAPLITEDMPVELDSGLVSNRGDAEAVVFSQHIFIPGAAALRLEFDTVELAGFLSDNTGSYLRIRSVFDGAEQRLNALHVEQWQNTSCYFNGDEVIVEIVAQPGTGDNRLVMTSVQAQFTIFDPESICGSTDDRLPSEDNRAARLLPIGCTGWLINDCNNCFLTAGHCSTSNGSVTSVQFNVPLSDSNGSLNHPPPEDQYAVDTTSRQSNNGGGTGNDYAYFGVFPNSNTGLTPAEAYGEVYELVEPPPVQGQDIRITGYGTTGNDVPREWNQAQKTHVGPYFSFSGTRLQYQTDTTGGNSGSPVINEDTGQAIGIHTHAGCGTNSGNNGTGANHPGLQAYLDNPQGVCQCPTLTFFYPEGRPEYVDPSGGTEIVVEVLANADVDPEPGTGTLYFNDGSGFISYPMDQIVDNVYVATIAASECNTIVEYYFSAETSAGEVALDPRNAPTDAYDALAVVAFSVVASDDFNNDTGWAVQSENTSQGEWERSVPVNIGNGTAPLSDFDGSGWCFVTGNAIGASDVDGGPTRLISPAYDIAGLGDPFVSYARWFFNDPANDLMVVEVSDDNENWVLAQEITDGGRAWREDGFRVREFLPDATTVQIRFSVQDNPDDSTLEAAIDAFFITDVDCGGCAGDFNGDGDANTIDVLDFLNAWAAGDDDADFNGDGMVNTIDVLEFLNAWNAGC